MQYDNYVKPSSQLIPTNFVASRVFILYYAKIIRNCVKMKHKISKCLQLL